MLAGVAVKLKLLKHGVIVCLLFVADASSLRRVRKSATKRWMELDECGQVAATAGLFGQAAVTSANTWCRSTMSPTLQLKPVNVPANGALTCNSIFIDSSTITV